MIVKQIKVQILDPHSETNDDAREPWNAQALVVVDRFAIIFNAMASLISSRIAYKRKKDLGLYLNFQVLNSLIFLKKSFLK